MFSKNLVDKFNEIYLQQILEVYNTTNKIKTDFL